MALLKVTESAWEYYIQFNGIDSLQSFPCYDHKHEEICLYLQSHHINVVEL